MCLQLLASFYSFFLEFIGLSSKFTFTVDKRLLETGLVCHSQTQTHGLPFNSMHLRQALYSPPVKKTILNNRMSALSVIHANTCQYDLRNDLIKKAPCMSECCTISVLK